MRMSILIVMLFCILLIFLFVLNPAHPLDPLIHPAGYIEQVRAQLHF